MPLFLRLRIVVSGLLLAVCCRAETGLSSFDAVYDVELRGMRVATLSRHFVLHADGQYEFESLLESEGLAALVKRVRERETSRGRWVNGVPRPDLYQYEKRAGAKNRSATLSFDWQVGTVAGQEGTKSWQARLPPDSTDKLGYQLRLMQDMAAERQLEYRVADDGRVKTQAWERIGTPQIRLGNKTFETVQVAYTGRGQRRTVLWCAPKLDFLPVRIEYQEKSGEVATATLRQPRAASAAR